MFDPSKDPAKTDPDVVPPPPSEPFPFDLFEPYIRLSGNSKKPGRQVLRLHGYDKANGRPWSPVFFSRAGKTRWDHPDGPGFLCLGHTMPGVLLEYFGSRWPAVVAAKYPLAKRYLTDQDLRETFRTRLTLPPDLKLLDLTKPNALNALGVDSLLLATHRYQYTRPWGKWFADCADLDGLMYNSRPGGSGVKNIVLFQRDGLAKKLEASCIELSSLQQLLSKLKPTLRALQVLIAPPPIPPTD